MHIFCGSLPGLHSSVEPSDGLEAAMWSRAQEVHSYSEGTISTLGVWVLENFPIENGPKGSVPRNGPHALMTRTGSNTLPTLSKVTTVLSSLLAGYGTTCL